MTTYYNVEIQMAGDNKATQDFISLNRTFLQKYCAVEDSIRRQ